MSSVTHEGLEAAPDPAVARAERRLALLEEMAEIGMNLLRGLSADEDSEKAVEAFAKVSRAVRLTLALEARTDRELAELIAAPKAGWTATADGPVGADPETSGRFNDPLRNLRNERKARAFDLVVAVSESESESLDDLLVALDAPAETELGEGPDLHPVIERLCRDLGLPPELSRRVGEGWQAGYLACRPRFNPVGWNGAAPDRPPAPA